MIIFHKISTFSALFQKRTRNLFFPQFVFPYLFQYLLSCLRLEESAFLPLHDQQYREEEVVTAPAPVGIGEGAVLTHKVHVAGRHIFLSLSGMTTS